MRAALAIGLALAAAPAAPVAAPSQFQPSPAARAAVAALPPYRAGRPVSGRIILWGHGSAKRDFVGALVRRWMAEFQRGQPGITLDYRMYGSASAIGALATGAGNLALLGEEISPDQARTFRRARGYAPTPIEIANGSVQTNYFDYAHMIFVNRANPIAKLNLRQLEALFGAEHRCTVRNIRSWGQLGLKGEWAGKPITPYAWKTDIDFALFFRERVLCGSHRWNPATREFMPIVRPDGAPYDHGQQIVDAVARDPGGIGISNLRYARPEVKALALAWSPRGPFVGADDASLIARQYPLVRIIPAYVDRPPGKPIEPAVAEFLRYVLSREGQTALAEESGYLPLSPAVAAREAAKLK
ncbi:MAG: phosphate transport system substrate-binding protein [Sphingomonadales bacterium]|jgi:phosphate transport system substrate-binding protein|nr:phosphate transport system substrate-binding protein [Sphingomonadales bacterium]